MKSGCSLGDRVNAAGVVVRERDEQPAGASRDAQVGRHAAEATGEADQIGRILAQDRQGRGAVG